MITRPATRLPRSPALGPAEAIVAVLNTTFAAGLTVTVANGHTVLAALADAGWQLVPKVPTEAMTSAGAIAIQGHGVHFDEASPVDLARETWPAMLAARPK